MNYLKTMNFTMEKTTNTRGLRFNEGKNQLDLISPLLLEEVGKILTFGAKKYGRYNYRKGMEWSKCIASLKRHLNEFEKGVDFDDESNELHISHVLVNALFLLEYYKCCPDLDDRDIWYKKPLKRVYLDLDGVCVDFEKHFLEYFSLPKHDPTDWQDYRFVNNLNKISNNNDFWLSCPPLIDPKSLSYPITGYCTARDCSVEIVHQWLEKNNFPKGEVISIGFGGDKVAALKGKCDVMLDDSIKNFVELNSNGILCYLMTRPHNSKYDVGHLRMDSMEQFINNLK